MKRRILFIGIGVFAFALFLLARVPASVAFERLPAGLVEARGLQGSIWSGQAEQIIVQGLALGRTEWRWSASNLLKAELAYRVESSLDGHDLQGLVASRSDGTLRLVEVSGQVPLSALAATLPTGFFTGLVKLDVRELVLDQYWPSKIDADVQVERLTALTTNPPTLLGDYQLTFDNQQEFPIQGGIEDSAGPLAANGFLNLDAERRFVLELQLSPKPEAGDSIRGMLRFIGPADANGQHRLLHSGRL